MNDWRSILGEREKYQAYLCSREWAVLKEAIHARAKGVCERCGIFSIDAVHHLTYERKYGERLEDLAGWCKHCHDFTHGKGDFDPDSGDCRRIAKYVKRVKSTAQMPGLGPKPTHAVPHEIQGHLCEPAAHIQFLTNAIDGVYNTPICNSCDCIAFAMDYAAEAINTLLPFDYVGFRPIKYAGIHVSVYDKMLRLLGCEQGRFERARCGEEESDINLDDP